MEGVVDLAKLLMILVIVGAISSLQEFAAVSFGAEFSLQRMGSLFLNHMLWWAMPVFIVSSFARSFRQALLFAALTGTRFECIFPSIRKSGRYRLVIAGAVSCARNNGSCHALAAPNLVAKSISAFFILSLVVLVASLFFSKPLKYSRLVERHLSVGWSQPYLEDSGRKNDQQMVMLGMPLTLDAASFSERFVRADRGLRMRVSMHDGETYSSSDGIVAGTG